MSTEHIVGISDCSISANPADTIVTYALGSCVGVVIYDPQTKVGGLLHLLLPTARLGIGKDDNPFAFADTGIRALATGVIRMGGRRDRLVAKAAGGSNMLSSAPILDVGKRNVAAALETLKELSIPLKASSFGGTVGRSLVYNLNDASITVRLLSGTEEIL